MPLPKHVLRVGALDRELGDSDLAPESLRRQIEPWLSAVFQSEHLALLLGNGFTTAIALQSGASPTTMDRAAIEAPHADKVDKRARNLAADSARGSPNIEDQLRAALQLVAGLEVLEDEAATPWKQEINRLLTDFVASVIATEQGIAAAIESETTQGVTARDQLVSFLLSFSSRTSSRERLNIFTTNYDRLIEYGCDLVGLRPLDRFVGGLSPRFRASRLEIDMHYNPPGIRGEPRYLEGVVKLTKLHGSIDWQYVNREIRRVAMPFGDTTGEPQPVADPYSSLIIYPNPAKDVETLEYPYAELFRDLAAALCRPNSALVTYGYGFGDDHINRVIEDMLSIPSTHLVVIAFSDAGDRIATFLERVGRAAQISLLIGPHLGELATLVEHYLPKPAIDPITLRQAELLRRRQIEGKEGIESDRDSPQDDAL